MKIYSGGPLDYPQETLAQMLHRVARTHPTRTGFRARSAKGQPYRDHTWQESERMVDEVGNALLSAGVSPGDRVGILSETRMEWALADFGALSAGAVVVTIYPTLTAEQIGYLLNDSGATVLFVENQTQLDKVAQVAASAPKLRRVVT
ncbi:MAG TPA: AMP-binding protein, partial [Candidatus Thermoplasmatota archaeon]|nr:AMP-binding protein [Candidatus Thermoplasmatota archaeon]